MRTRCPIVLGYTPSLHGTHYFFVTEAMRHNGGWKYLDCCGPYADLNTTITAAHQAEYIARFEMSHQRSMTVKELIELYQEVR